MFMIKLHVFSSIHIPVGRVLFAVLLGTLSFLQFVCTCRRRGIRMTLWIPRRPQHTRHSYHLVCDKGACWVSGCFFLFFFLTPSSRDKVSRSCFTGQLPGIGIVFILASLQMCKVQRQGPSTKSGCFAPRLSWQCLSGELEMRTAGQILETICCVSLICVLQKRPPFADTEKKKAQKLLDTLMTHLAAAGLTLNTSKAVESTTEA